MSPVQRARIASKRSDGPTLPAYPSGRVSRRYPAPVALYASTGAGARGVG
jgi:hypothetical protein